MGSFIAQSSVVSSRTEEIVVENYPKENKKKRRRSRKSKQALSACTPASDSCIDASSLHHMVSDGHHQQPKDCYEDIGLISSMHANAQTTDGNLQDQLSFPHEGREPILAPGPSVSEGPVEPALVPQPVDHLARRKYFPPYWSADAINKGLEVSLSSVLGGYHAKLKISTITLLPFLVQKGELLRAVFRVNAHNRLEAYCKIEGVQTDVLITGVVAQNRAIDGDTVAIVVDSPSLWPRMKGLSETSDNATSNINFHNVATNVGDCSKGKCKIDAKSEYVSSCNYMFTANDSAYHDNESTGAMLDMSHGNDVLDDSHISSCQTTASDSVYDSRISLGKLCALVGLLPSKRPTGTVVAVTERSVRRDTIVGFLSVKQWIYNRESKRKNSRKNKYQSDLDYAYVLLTPTDPRFTKMMVPLRNLPASIRKRLEAGDLTIECDLVAAKVVDWAEESHIPEACVVQVFGRGSDIEAQIAAILYANAIDASDFSSEVFSCLPHTPWEVPPEEFQSRRDLRNLCIFTIDPLTATDLDDALSVETLPNGNFRVGVHIADASYFVQPDTALDIDAQIRSTSVYLLQRKLPMLPPVLSDDFASLNPGVDRLAFTIFWEMNFAGEVVDHWIGLTIVQSCCKLSYAHAQDIIDGVFDFQDYSQTLKHWPNLYGRFDWCDVIESVKKLHGISEVLMKHRFESGALSLESPKVVFLFDEDGIPYDTVASGRKNSNFLVEEFMLLANKTAAEVITRTYPSCALLRRHPEPNARKLREFESFCNKHGLKLDVSSSAHLHNSLEHIRRELKNDSVLLAILMSYAARPMQLATYFCSGELIDNSDHGHYALAIPLYTHFDSFIHSLHFSSETIP